MSSARTSGRVTPGIIVIGDDTNDSIYGGASADTLNGRGGNDYLYGGGGNDTINGGDGKDTAGFSGYAAEFAITYDASAGRYTVTDSISGRSGTDFVTGVELFSFYDGTIAAGPKTLGTTLIGTSAGETLQGGAGGDSLMGNEGDDRLIGGGGNDVLYDYYGNNTAVFSGRLAEYSVTRDSYSGQYTVTDLVAGRDGTDTINGYFIAFEFSDGSVAPYNIGNYYGTSADDTLTGTGADEYFSGGYGNDTLVGGGGIDTAAYYGRYAEYIVAFDAGTGSYTVTDKVGGRDGSDKLSGIEYLQFYDVKLPIVPSNGGQVVLGTDSSDVLTGGAGDDSLYGGKYGDDTFIGGGGNDLLQGGGGATATAAYGGVFADYVITYDGNANLYTIADKVSGRDGTDYLTNIDKLKFADVTLPIGTSPGGQSLTGTNGPDQLTGGDGNDSLSGGRGSDMLNGGNGIDILLGGDGNDRLDGGNGNDWLNGGHGNDVLIGRAGTADTAIYSGNHADYQIVFNSANNTYQITDTVADRDGVDTLSGIENLQFADGTWPVGPTVGATALIGIDPLHGADIA